MSSAPASPVPTSLKYPAERVLSQIGLGAPPIFEFLELSAVIFEVLLLHVDLEDMFQVTCHLLPCIHPLCMPVNELFYASWLAFVQEIVLVVIELMMIGGQARACDGESLRAYPISIDDFRYVCKSVREFFRQLDTREIGLVNQMGFLGKGAKSTVV